MKQIKLSTALFAASMGLAVCGYAEEVKKAPSKESFSLPANNAHAAFQKFANILKVQVLDGKRHISQEPDSVTYLATVTDQNGKKIGTCSAVNYSAGIDENGKEFGFTQQIYCGNGTTESAKSIIIQKEAIPRTRVPDLPLIKG